MAIRYTIRNKEDKLSIVKSVLSGTSATEHEKKGIADHYTIMGWVKKYQQEGEVGLGQKNKPGNQLSGYERRKELTYKN